MGSLRLVVLASAFGVVVNVALNLYLIPAYSTTGAAGATVFSETLGFLLIAAIAHRTLPALPLRRGVLLRFAVVLAATGGMLALTDGRAWWLALPAALATCVVSSALLRVATREDVRLLLERRRLAPGG